MKVSYLLASSEIGGGNRSLSAIWPVLRRRGVDVHVIAPGMGPMVEACREQQIPCDAVDYVQPAWRTPIRSWRAYRTWTRVLRAAAPDVVHANALEGGRAVTCAARRLGVPLVCHLRFPPDEKTTRWMFRGLPKPDLFVFNSRALRLDAGAQIARAYPGAEQRTIYNAVDLDAFRPSPAETRRTVRVGIIANLSEIKGHGDFLRMAKLLVDRGAPCEFWIVGGNFSDSAYERTLHALVAELGIGHLVRFLGFRADMPALISDLDIIVSSSHYESFGRSLLEAMVCERPVVATKVGGVPEVVEDGVTGLLTPPRDPAALAAAVERLAGDPALRARMGRAGRVRAIQRFSTDTCATQLIEVYTHVGRRRRSARAAARPIRVVFRYDDCSARSSLELERGFVDAFAACGAQVTLGVIPAVVEGSFRDREPQTELSLPAEKIAWLKSAAAAGHAEIALHGYTHQLSSDKELTEFAGCPESQQEAKISAGTAALAELFGGLVTTFIPPWNSYDAATLAVLEQHGFTCLSASVRGPFSIPTSLDLLPGCCHFDALKNVVRVARILRRANPVVVVVIHDFDFFESGNRDAYMSVADFATRLREVAAMPGVQLLSLRQACAGGAAARLPSLLEPHRLWWTRIQRFSWRYRSLLDNQVLWSGTGARAARVWLRQSCVATYCLWHSFVPAIKRRLFAH
jgi:glycosyltransferase involved in cell wall biosynthesis/predicted deacetylase